MKDGHLTNRAREHDRDLQSCPHQHERRDSGRRVTQHHGGHEPGRPHLAGDQYDACDARDRRLQGEQHGREDEHPPRPEGSVERGQEAQEEEVYRADAEQHDDLRRVAQQEPDGHHQRGDHERGHELADEREADVLRLARPDRSTSTVERPLRCPSPRGARRSRSVRAR